MARVEVRIPELGMPGEPIRLTVWHTVCGGGVEVGEPLLEITAGAVTIDLPAPVSGLLAERLAAEDDLLRPGDPVAILETGG